ncbi:peptidyl-prolyl cis-trans isomerase [Candidatus Latescibacterota bacterium]
MKNILIITIFILFVSVSTVFLLNASENAFDKTVVRVDNIVFTEYELEKRMELTHPTDTVEILLNNFIDRAYFLIEASKRGYMENAGINEAVEKAAKMAVVREPDGLLFSEVAYKNIKANDEILKRFYVKYKQLFDVEYLKFSDYTEMATVLGQDSLMTSEKEFYRYVQDSKNNPNISFNTRQLTWPFFDFLNYQDYLFDLKPGQISRPMCNSQGVYIVHVLSINEGENYPFEEKKETISELYEKSVKLKKLFQYERELFTSADAIIFDETIEKIYSRLNIKEQNFVIEESTYQDILNETAMSFYLDGEQKVIAIGDFIDYYQNQLIRYWINTRIKLANFFKDWVVAECGYREAQKLGITKTKQFLLNKKIYKDEIIYQTFINEDLKNSITVSDNEISDAYHNRIISIEDGTAAEISVFHFDSIAHAFPEYVKFLESLSKGIIFEVDVSDSTKGLIGKELGVSIKYDNNEYPTRTIQSVFSSEDNSVIRSSEKNGRTYVIYKHSESGSRIKPLEEVRDEIEQKLRQEKLEVMKKELLVELKQKYPIENNIDYDKYLNRQDLQN